MNKNILQKKTTNIKRSMSSCQNTTAGSHIYWSILLFLAVIIGQNKQTGGFENFPPQGHLSKRHAVKMTAKSPWRQCVRHKCGTWAEGEILLAENASEQDEGGSLQLTRRPCCNRKGVLNQRTVTNAELWLQSIAFTLLTLVWQHCGKTVTCS